MNRQEAIAEQLIRGKTLPDSALDIIEAVLAGEYERCYDGTYRVSEVHGTGSGDKFSIDKYWGNCIHDNTVDRGDLSDPDVCKKGKSKSSECPCDRWKRNGGEDEQEKA